MKTLPDILNGHDFAVAFYKDNCGISFNPADFNEQELAVLDGSFDTPLRIGDGTRFYGLTIAKSLSEEDYLTLKLLGSDRRDRGIIIFHRCVEQGNFE